MNTSMHPLSSDKQEITYINVSTSCIPSPLQKGFDPEMLYVECSRCGAPVYWEPGKSTALLREVGIDPLELDPACMLVTSGCPLCGNGRSFSVRVVRLSDTPPHRLPKAMGTA